MSIFQRRLVRADDVRRIGAHLRQFEHHYGPVEDAQRVTLLQQLLQEKAATGLMVERNSADAEVLPEIVALGISGFLSIDDANMLLESPPEEPVVDRMYALEQQGRQPLLRPEQIARANAGDGLALIFLHFSLPPGNPEAPETQQALALMQSSFRLHNGGYHCRMALHPVPQGDPKGRQSLLQMGFEPVGNGDTLMVFDLRTIDQYPYHPFNCLRRSRAPTLGLSPGEKELLNLALWGNSDALIAESLNISLDTVRKRWRKVFQKIEDQPDLALFPESQKADATQTRGPEKRQRVLQFIDTHLEEIRLYQRA
jgi:DNA-binding CsgD family transcriptional regulator